MSIDIRRLQIQQAVSDASTATATIKYLSQLKVIPAQKLTQANIDLEKAWSSMNSAFGVVDKYVLAYLYSVMPQNPNAIAASTIIDVYGVGHTMMTKRANAGIPEKYDVWMYIKCPDFAGRDALNAYMNACYLLGDGNKVVSLWHLNGTFIRKIARSQLIDYIRRHSSDLSDVRKFRFY